MTYQPGDAVRVIYAYDGSGIALRAAATIVGDTDDRYLVRLENPTDDALRCLRDDTAADGLVAVPGEYITAPDTPAPVASFGWLD